MSWIKEKIEGFLITRVVARIAGAISGKKTIVGAISLLLWVAIYAIPAFTPEYNWIVVYATQLRDLLLTHGVVLDNSLFNAGVGFTVVGLADKARKIYLEYKKDKQDE